MHVGVGSRNPAKVEATERALSHLADRVEPVGADPGVPDQPRGFRETLQGAENRAREALPGRDLGVGIEGGVAEVDGRDDLFLIVWAAVTDGDRTGQGTGPTIRLPDRVARRVRDGEELGPVVDDLTGEREVNTGRGAMGVFSDGELDRPTALAVGVRAALGPVASDHYE